MPTWRLVAADASGTSVAQGLTRENTPMSSLSVGAKSWSNNYKARDTYTLGQLYVRVTVNSLNVGTTFRSMKNDVDGSQSVAIGAGATGVFEDNVNSDSLVSGDTFRSRTVVSAGAGSITFTVIAFNLTAASGVPIIGGGGGAIFFGQTVYCPAVGFPAFNATEAYSQYVVRTATTLTNLRIAVEVNSLNGSVTFRTRKNGVNGNLSVSIGAGATGNFEDNVNSDALAAGDTLNEQAVAGGSSGVVVVYSANVKYTSAARLMACANPFSTPTTYGPGVTRYLTAEADSQDSDAVEANAQVNAKATFTLKNLLVRVATNTLDGATTVRTRKNGGNGSLSVGIAAGGTGAFEDNVNSDSLVSGDLINYQVVTLGGSGALWLTIVGTEQQETPAPPPSGTMGNVPLLCQAVGAM